MADWIREPAVAGKFYPAQKLALERELARCLGGHERDEGQGPQFESARVAIGPHAGYMYSGAIAGALYAKLRVPQRCIILSPNHTGRGARMALWPRGSWRTPLGDIPVDEGLAHRLSQTCPAIEEDRRAHLFEHSLEVHLPFLQTRQPTLNIVPLTLSYLRADECVELGRAVAEVVATTAEEVLIVASTDMSHYLPAAEARELDHLALAQVTALNPRGLHETVERKAISMCGVIPTTAALESARALGASHAEVLSYGNSGDVSGDYSSVVGYASVRLV